MAQCLEVDVASQGESKADALENLAEALRLHFTPPVAAELSVVSDTCHGDYVREREEFFPGKTVSEIAEEARRYDEREQQA